MKLKCMWFGYGGGSWMAEKLRHIIEDKLEMQLITIHEHPDANIPWNISTVFEELKKADIIIVPANFKRQLCKSANRLTQAMALGKPIICDPLPAYMDVIVNFHNGIILRNGSEDEWEYTLDLLKTDKVLRRKLSENALETSKKYTKRNMAKKWLDVLTRKPEDTNTLVVPEGIEILELSESEVNNIDVLIPTKNNIEIIDECLKSFNNSKLDEEIYIIDNDTDSDKLEELVKKYGIPYEVKEI